LLASVLALVALAVSQASSVAQTEVDRLLDGSAPFSLGVDTSRFRVSTLGPKSSIGTEDPALSSVPYRLIDSDLLGTAMSFDLKLRWPSGSASGSSAMGSLAPYLSFGPTVLVPGAEGVTRPGQPGYRNDGPMALGLSWGAGLSWRFATRSCSAATGSCSSVATASRPAPGLSRIPSSPATTSCTASPFGSDLARPPR
jgi:hypothetical protein